MLIKFFNSNSGLGSMTDQLFIYDVHQALKANAFTKTGYTFLVGQLPTE